MSGIRGTCQMNIVGGGKNYINSLRIKAPLTYWLSLQFVIHVEKCIPATRM